MDKILLNDIILEPEVVNRVDAHTQTRDQNILLKQIYKQFQQQKLYFEELMRCVKINREQIEIRINKMVQELDMIQQEQEQVSN